MESLKYKIVSTNSKGRSLIAAKSISTDEIILVDSPLVSSQFSWNKAYGYLACDYCMFPLETAEQNLRRLAFNQSIVLPHPELDPTKDVQLTAVQCDGCSAKFCSPKCLSEAEEKYHKVTCGPSKPGEPFDQINEIWKNMHYPPEEASILLIIRIFSMIKIKPELLATFSEFCDRSVNEDLSICHKMLGEKFTSQLEELHQAFVQVFAGDEVLSKYLTLEGLTQIFAMIGTNAQGIGTSSFSGWVRNVTSAEGMTEQQRAELDELIDTLYTTLEETVGRQFLDNEGSGLYLMQSKINHSCNPNAEIRFPYSNNVLQVVALREIKANEEICISYIDECQLSRSRHSRQKHLQQNYLFECECEKCQEEIDQPDVTSDEDEEGMDTDSDN